MPLGLSEEEDITSQDNNTNQIFTTSNNRNVEPLSDDEYNKLMNPIFKHVDSLNAKSSIPEMVEVSPEQSVLYDMDTVNIVDANGSSSTYRLSNVFAEESVNKENELFSELKKARDPVYRASIAEKIRQNGLEKDSIDSSLKDKLDDFRKDWDITGVIPSASNNTGTYGRKIAEDVIMRHKITGEVSTLKMLSVESGYATTPEFDTENEGKNLSRIQRQIDGDKAEYIRNKNIRDGYNAELAKHSNVLDKSLEIANNRIYSAIESGKISKEDGENLVASLSKTHKLKFHSKRSQAKKYIQSSIQSLVSSNAGAEKVMRKLIEARRANVDIKLDENTYNYLKSSVYDKDGTYKKKYKTEEARIKYRESVNSIIETFRPKNAKKKFSTIDRHGFNFLKNTQGMREREANAINNRVHWFTGTNVDSSTDTTIADINDFSVKYNLDPRKLVKAMAIIDANPEDTLNDINKLRKKIGIKEISGMLSSDETLVKEGYSDTIAFLENEDTYGLSKKQKNARKAMLSKLKEDVKYVNYAQGFDHDVIKESVGLFDKAVMRNAIKFGNIVKEFVGEEETPMTPFNIPKKETDELVSKNEIAPYEAGFIDTTLNTVGSVATFFQSPTSKIAIDGLISTFSDEKSLSNIVEKRLDKAKVTGTSWGGVASEFGTGAGKFVTVAKGVSKVLAKAGVKNKYVAGGAIATADVSSDAVLGTYSSDSKVRASSGYLNPLVRAQATSTSELITGASLNLLVGAGISKATNMMKTKISRTKKGATERTSQGSTERTDEDYEAYFQNIFYDNHKDKHFTESFDKEKDRLAQKNDIINLEGKELESAEDIIDDQSVAVSLFNQIVSLKQEINDKKLAISGSKASGDNASKLQDEINILQDNLGSKNLVLASILDNIDTLHERHKANGYKELDLAEYKNTKDDISKEDISKEDIAIHDDAIYSEVVKDIDEIITSVKQAKDKNRYKDKSDEDIEVEIQNILGGKYVDVSLNTNENISSASIIDKFIKSIAPVAKDMNDKEIKFLDEATSLGEPTIHPTRDGGETASYQILDSKGNPVTNASEAQSILHRLFSYNEKNKHGVFDGIFVGSKSSLLKPILDKETGAFYLNSYSNRSLHEGTELRNTAVQNIITNALKHPDVAVHILKDVISKDKTFLPFLKKNKYVKEDGTWNIGRAESSSDDSLYKSGDVIFTNNKGKSVNAYQLLAEHLPDADSYHPNTLILNALNIKDRKAINSSGTNADVARERQARIDDNNAIIQKIKQLKERHIIDYDNPQHYLTQVIDHYNAKAGEEKYKAYGNDSVSMFFKGKSHSGYGNFDKPLSILNFIKEVEGKSDNKEATKHLYEILGVKNNELDSALSETGSIEPKQDYVPIYAREPEVHLEQNTKYDDSTGDVPASKIAVSAYATIRNLRDKIGSMNTTDLIESFVNNGQIIISEHMFGHKQLSFYNDKGNYIFGRGIVRRNTSGRHTSASIKDGDGNTYANLKNYNDGVADITVIAESMPDAIAYLQAQELKNNIDVTPDTKIQIIDMDGLPSPKKIDGIRKDVSGSSRVVFAKDKKGDETDAQLREIDNLAKSDFIDRTEEPPTHKDWNEHIENYNDAPAKEKETATMLDKVKKAIYKRIDEKNTDIYDYRIHNEFIDNALNEIEGLVDIFRKSTSNDRAELTKHSDEPQYSVKSGKIRLPKSTKIQNVTHEIIHAIQEKTILRQKNTDIKDEYQIIDEDIRYLVEDITNIGRKGNLPESIQAKFNEFAQAYEGQDLKNENATREMLVHMFEDGEFAHEMYTHRIVDNNGKKSLEKITEVSPEDSVSHKENIFTRILDGITGFLESIKSLGGNIHKDSVGARVIYALSNNNELHVQNKSVINESPTNILYATTEKTINNSFYSGIKKKILEGKHGEDNKVLIDGVLKLYDWADKKFFSGEMSNVVRKVVKYTTSTYDTNAKLDEISKMNEQASSKAKVKANAFIESVKNLDFELTETERMGALALIRYDISSLTSHDIVKSIKAIASNNIDFFSSRYSQAKDAISKIGEMLREDNPLSEIKFNADIQRLSKFVIQNKFSTNTKINSIEIVKSAFHDYGLDKAQIQSLASHVDEFITMQALSNKSIFNKLHDRLKSSDSRQLENISQMFAMYKSSTEGFEAIGRKGDIIDNTLTESTLIAVPKEFVDGLSSSEKKIFKKRNTFDGGDGWYYIKETDSSIQTQESIIKEPSIRDDIDAKIEGLEKEDLDMFTDAYNNGKINEAINSHYEYLQNKGENVYAVIKNDKVVALRRTAPIKKLITEQSSPENILYNLVYSKDTKMHTSLIHEYALEQMDIVSTKFATPVAEKNYIDGLKDSILKESTEVPDNMIFINPSVFRFIDQKQKSIFSSPAFKEKYRKISSEDRKYLPEAFSGEKYVRADMYDDLITQPLDMGIKAIHTSSLVRKALNHVSSTVGLFKYAVVASNPDSFLNNVAFNSVITSMYMGTDFSPVKISKDTKLLIEYQQLVMDAQKAKIIGDKNYKSLQKKVDTHRMAKYDNLGMFSSMVDGIETTGGKEQHKFYNFVVDTFTSNVPKNYHPKGTTAKVIRNMFFAEGSKTNKIAGNSVRFGDFVFRISLYDHLLEKYQTEKFGNMSKQEAEKKALETAMEQFVVSRKNTNKYVASADVYGIAMFARWRAKYFPAGYKALRDNPAKAIMIGTAIAMYEYNNNDASFKSSSIYPLATMFDDISSINEAKIPNIFSSAGEVIDTN